MLSPPSAAIVAPVTNDDSSLARNSTALAISSGRACRSSGIIPSKIRGRLVLARPCRADLDRVLEAVVDGPGMDAVHADALRRALLRRRPHETDERVLGRGVAEDPGGGRQAHDARVDDDRAGPVAHGRHRVLADEEGALDVDGHHLVEDVLRVLRDRRVAAEDAGVREGDVQPAEALHRELHRAGDGGRVGDVADRPGRDVRAQVGHDALHAVGVDVGHHDLRALGGEGPGGGAADAPAATGDERDLPLQAWHLRLVRARRRGSGAPSSSGTRRTPASGSPSRPTAPASPRRSRRGRAP